MRHYQVRLAVENYRLLKRAEKIVAKWTGEVHKVVATLTAEELSEYYSLTDAVDRQED